MVSDKRHLQSEQQNSAGSAVDSEPPPSTQKPARGNFWRELYWLVVICLLGGTIAIAVLPARAARHRSLLELERQILLRTARLEHEERELEAAILSLENDPFYREAVYRHVLGVKRSTEDFEPTATPRPTQLSERTPPPPEGEPDFRLPPEQAG